jgi:enamine deaminase RidA (YjgF/YER057c/UK114 family)
MRNALITVIVAGSILAPAARAENLSLVPPGGRVADLVRVPAGAEMAYVAGLTADPIAPGPPPRFGDTQAQTVNVLRKIQRLLESQGFSLEDVVMMRVALVGDPAKHGALDFAGMNAGYAQFFTATHHKPARMTTRVAALVTPGALVEIEVQAARTPSAPQVQAQPGAPK